MDKAGKGGGAEPVLRDQPNRLEACPKRLILKNRAAFFEVLHRKMENSGESYCHIFRKNGPKIVQKNEKEGEMSKYKNTSQKNKEELFVQIKK